MAKRATEAVVVLPSAWATLDVRCLHTLRELACVSSCRFYRIAGCTDLRVDTTNHVVRRNEYSSHSDTLWINRDGVPAPSSNRMTVKFHTCDSEIVSELTKWFPTLNSKKVEFRGESCTCFNAKILSTHHIRCCPNNGVHLEIGDVPIPLSQTLSPLHEQCIEFLGDLCQKTHDPDDHYGTQDRTSLRNEASRTRRQRHKKMRSCGIQTEFGHHYLIPSDHLTIVSFESSNTLGVLVSRFWVRRLDEERNFFLFFNLNSYGATSYS